MVSPLPGLTGSQKSAAGAVGFVKAGQPCKELRAKAPKHGHNSKSRKQVIRVHNSLASGQATLAWASQAAVLSALALGGAKASRTEAVQSKMAAQAPATQQVEQVDAWSMSLGLQASML